MPERRGWGVGCGSNSFPARRLSALRAARWLHRPRLTCVWPLGGALAQIASECNPCRGSACMSGAGLSAVAVPRSLAGSLNSAVSRRRLVLAGLWVTAAAAQWGALRPVITGEHKSPAVILYHVVGASFAVCGLLAWYRRPDARTGPLDGGDGLPVLRAAVAEPRRFVVGADGRDGDRESLGDHVRRVACLVSEPPSAVGVE